MDCAWRARWTWPIAVAAAGLLAAGAACAPVPATPSPAASPAAPAASTPAAAKPAQKAPAAVNVPAEAEAAVQAARQQAASRLNVDAGRLTLMRVESRQWRDSSLGCPQPGQMYAQVITPGYLVVIAGPNQQQLAFHTDTRGRAVLCEP